MNKTLVALIATLSCGSPSAAFGQNSPEQWRLTRAITIGSVDGPDIITSGGPVTVSTDGGTIYLGQRERHIRVFDVTTRRLIQIIGGDGQGPGEFQTVSNLGWKQDTLWVTDRALQRVNYFTQEGSFIRTERIAPTLSDGGAATPIALAADGTVIGEGSVNLGVIASGQVSKIPVVLMDRTGRLIKTLSERDVSSTAAMASAGNRIAIFALPFPDTDLHAIDSKGASLLHVKASSAVPGLLAITRVTLSGDTIYSRLYNYQPQPVPQQVVDSIHAHFARGFTSLPEGQALRAAQIHVTVPPTYPPVTHAVLAEDGSAWLRRESRGLVDTQWLVFAPDGAHRAVVTTPANLRIAAVGHGRVWGVVPDGSLGVPYLVGYNIER